MRFVKEKLWRKKSVFAEKQILMKFLFKIEALTQYVV